VAQGVGSEFKPQYSKKKKKKNAESKENYWRSSRRKYFKIFLIS
jgi:hypothetical protein